MCENCGNQYCDGERCRKPKTMTYADRYRAGQAYLIDLAADVQHAQDNPGAYPAEWSEDALLCTGATRCAAEVIVSDHRGRLCGQHARTRL